MLIDIQARMNEKVIASILSLCLYQPTVEKLNQIFEQYLASRNRFMLGYERGGRILGCAGIEIKEQGCAVLLHIAVDSTCRGQGIGSMIIHEVMRRFELNRLEAETDKDAVDFYQKCGFEITSLGEKYPGSIRYLC